MVYKNGVNSSSNPPADEFIKGAHSFLTSLTSLSSRISKDMNTLNHALRSRQRRYVNPILSSREREIPFLGSRRYISSDLEENREGTINHKAWYGKDPRARYLERSSLETKRVEKIFQRILVAMYKSLKIEPSFSVNGNEIRLPTLINGDQGGFVSNGGGCKFEYLKGMSWKIDVVDSYLSSISCGSRIFISSRDMQANQSEAEQACVIGHEIGHTIAKHGCEPDSHILYQLYKQEIPIISTIFEACYKHGSRERELEADYLGLVLAALAGYDPRPYIERFNTINVAANSDEEDIFSTHPSIRRRGKFLSRPQIMEQLTKLYEEAACKLSTPKHDNTEEGKKEKRDCQK